MKENRLRRRLEQGEVQIGTWLMMARNPAVLTLLKSAGVDFARIDMEFGGPSIETLADMAQLARALDFPIVVRPPVTSREWLTRLLGIGIWNFHCPQVETPEQAADIVAATRYAPRGLRGNVELGPATDFLTAPAAERAHANDQVFVTVMLETARAFDHLDDIAAMDGIDCLTLGPADLAQDLGIVGSPDRARILDEKRVRVLDAARRHGKACAMLAGSPEQVRQWRDAGVKLLAYSSDIEMLHGGFSRAMARLKDQDATA